MKFKITFEDVKKVFFIIIGVFIFSLGMNIFIVPMGLYSGGLLGMAQLLRTLAERYMGLSIGFDISGIISFVLNIPLMIITYKTVGKEFILKTVFCIAVQSVFLSVIPIKEIIGDPLTSSIIGGIMCGFGIGLVLQNGGSSGGVEIIGMYYAKKSDVSVGRISLLLNVFVYSAAFLIIADIRRIIYTLIYAAINTITLDRMHTQNINSEVIIISKLNNDEIQNAIIHEMRRGVSFWSGYGAFTGEDRRVLYVIVSKYELSKLKKIVYKIDPSAFISIKNGVSITGNFEKRL